MDFLQLLLAVIVVVRMITLITAGKRKKEEREERKEEEILIMIRTGCGPACQSWNEAREKSRAQKSAAQGDIGRCKLKKTKPSETLSVCLSVSPARILSPFLCTEPLWKPYLHLVYKNPQLCLKKPILNYIYSRKKNPGVNKI